MTRVGSRATDETLVASTTAGEDTGGAGPGGAFDVGHSVGRYVVLGRVGAGGMGVVYAAYDPELDRKVALKVLLAEGVTSAARMQREAQAMARIGHPNVVAVFDVGTHEGRVFVAMEFVDGQTLGAWIANDGRARDSGDVLDALVDAGRGLAAAHAAGLVHRDFKPDNVLVGHDGRVRVTDFGLARAEATDAELERPTDAAASTGLGTPLTRVGAIMGTPAYMAPEQHLGLETDARTDQFCFCVATWEALYGARPFAGKTLAALAEAVTEGRRVEPPGTARVPTHVRRALERGLCVSAEDRHPTMEALLDALTADPRRGRRRVLAAVAVGGTVAAVAAALSVDRARRVEACVADSSVLSSSWDNEARAEIEAAFETAFSGAEFARTTASNVLARLDGWSEGWRVERNRSCTAAMVTRSRGANIAARSEACFDHAQAIFKATVSQLRSADRVAVQRAVRSVSSLPDVTQCNDERLLALAPTPVGAEHQAAAREVSSAIARAYAASRSAHYDEARSEATQALELAEALGVPSVVARARTAAGTVESHAGAFKVAEPLLRLAFEESLGSGDDSLAAYAATELAHVADWSRAAYGESVVWGGIAVALLERLGLGESPRVADVHDHLGHAFRLSGDLDGADAAYRKALDIRETTLGSEHADLADALEGLANVAVERGEWATAEKAYERGLALRAAVYGQEHSLVTNTLTAVANMYEIRKRHDEALELHTRVLAANETFFGPDHVETGISLNNIAVLLNAAGRHAEAEANYTRALQIWSSSFGPEHPILAHAHWGLANAMLGQGRVDDAITHAERCLALRKNDVPGEIAEAQFVLAKARAAKGDTATALELATAARDVFAGEGERRKNDLDEVETWMSSQSLGPSGG